MVSVGDFKKLTEYEDYVPKGESGNLLKKYGIPIQHIDFAYVEKCTDSKELEKILQILRSGEEGFYPDLIKATEKQLAAVKPKSKLLRKVQPVLSRKLLSSEQRGEIDKDLKQFVNEISESDQKLEKYKNKKGNKNLPTIREGKCETEKKVKTNKRIASTDYKSWDKYDPDTEILKMDLEEKRIKKEIKEQTAKKAGPKKTVQFKDFDTEIEALHEANYERDKGNDFFKNGEYKNALRHYTNSINCKPTVPGLTNRALTHIRLRNYKNAIEDCHTALAIEPNNMKALIRKSYALQNLGQYQQALETVEQVIEFDPNNSLAQELADKFRKQCNVKLKNPTRMSIKDLDKKCTYNNKVIIPIAGSSKMSPPFYVTCSKNSPQKIKHETLKAANKSNQILHIVSIDGSDVDDDDDSCTTIHLKPSSIQNLTTRILDTESNIRTRQMTEIEDKNGGGEPFVKQEPAVEMPQDIHLPFSFLQTWHSANSDPTLEQYATILRTVDMNRIVEVIGNKLDSAMFTTLINCLCMHFTVPTEVEKLYSILQNIIRLPRFDIITLLMSEEDKIRINLLLTFLNQHGKELPIEILNKLLCN